MTFIINPGTGPVPEATLADAEANMRALVADVGAPDAAVEHRPDGDYQGRFAFALRYPTIEFEVDMPGLPLERVRFVGGADQNIWDFPRLYVDGSSWVWRYGLGIIADGVAESATSPRFRATNEGDDR